MRIGIDARPLAGPRTGMFRVLNSIILQLERIDAANEYYLYSGRDFLLPFANPRWHKRVGSRILFVPGTLWLQVPALRLMRQDQLDVFWGTCHVLPLGLPATVSAVVTIHDVVWRMYPATMTRFNWVVHSLLVEPSVRKARAVMVPSMSTARDVERFLGVSASKIRLATHGVSPNFQPQEVGLAAESMARKYGIAKEYILTVGTVEPRKNLVTLMEAMKIFRKETALSHQLVIAGGRGWKQQYIASSLQRWGLTASDVRFLDFVPDEDLALLYAGAAVFVFPSLYEGFGLPLVEAMACGVPVVASNVSSIPEVVQDAAILVPPRDARQFAQSIAAMISDAALRSSLIAKGLERARTFCWSEAAKQVLDLFTGLSPGPTT